MIGFEIRAGLPEDEDDLLSLATHLNTVNLPADRPAIRKILQTSAASYTRTLPKERRAHVFILRDLERQATVGTSTLVGQLGRRDAPYIYFDVDSEEKYSKDLGLHFDHLVLRLGFSYDGPTELAGIVVDPAYRRHPGRLGLSISYVRLLFLAAHRSEFRDEVLAELLPPLEPDGTSHLWDALGRRFTNMTYREADRLSHENKDFIRDLFPSGPVYASVLSLQAQAVIGEVGQQTRGVEKMLKRIGFRYAERVDPFDGGPHFVANTDEISVVRRHQLGPAQGFDPAPAEPLEHWLVARFSEAPPFIHAISTRARCSSAAIEISDEALEHLGVRRGEALHAVPMP